MSATRSRAASGHRRCSATTRAIVGAQSPPNTNGRISPGPPGTASDSMKRPPRDNCFAMYSRSSSQVGAALRAATVARDRTIGDVWREHRPAVLPPGVDVEERQRKFTPLRVDDPRDRGVRHHLRRARTGGHDLLRNLPQPDLLAPQVTEHGLHGAEVRRPDEQQAANGGGARSGGLEPPFLGRLAVP